MTNPTEPTDFDWLVNDLCEEIMIEPGTAEAVVASSWLAGLRRELLDVTAQRDELRAILQAFNDGPESTAFERSFTEPAELAVARRDAATTALNDAADKLDWQPFANARSIARWLRGRASMLASPEPPTCSTCGHGDNEHSQYGCGHRWPGETETFCSCPRPVGATPQPPTENAYLDPDAAADMESWRCKCGRRVGHTGDEIHAHGKEFHSCLNRLEES